MVMPMASGDRARRSGSKTQVVVGGASPGGAAVGTGQRKARKPTGQVALVGRPQLLTQKRSTLGPVEANSREWVRGGRMRDVKSSTGLNNATRIGGGRLGGEVTVGTKVGAGSGAVPGTGEQMGSTQVRERTSGVSVRRGGENGMIRVLVPTFLPPVKVAGGPTSHDRVGWTLRRLKPAGLVMTGPAPLS